MKNIITATIEFYFKGEKFTPSLTIELDEHMQSSGSIPNLYPLIARESNIDLYSYEYEMMLAEAIKITKAEGIISDFVENELLNTEEFEKAWKKQKILTELEDIVKRNMGIDNLDQHPDLKQTLLYVYYLDRNPSSR